MNRQIDHKLRFLGWSLLIFGMIFSREVQAKVIFGKLQFGPYAVGYKTIEKMDGSRTFPIPLDSKKKNIDNARPIQISIWYPARETGKHKPVTLRDYILSGANETEFDPAGEEARGKTVLANYKALIATNKIADEKIEEFLSTPSSAVQDAKAAQGLFPLILYAAGGNERAWENFILCEFLASYGYVVAASPSIGAFKHNFTAEVADFEAQLGDLEFTYSLMRRDPRVDSHKLLVMGFCAGFFSEVLFAKRNVNVNAMINLDGAIGIKEFRDLVHRQPYTDIRNLKASYLSINGSEKSRDSAFYDELIYSDAYELRFPDFDFDAFTSYYVLPNRLADNNKAKRVAAVNLVYETICIYALQFCNATLKGDPKAQAFLIKRPEENDIPKGFAVYQFKDGKPVPPSREEFKEILKTQGISKAVEVFKNAWKINPRVVLFNESDMNREGYRLLAEQKTPQAIEAFKLNVFAYPESWNAYDSLAEAYIAAGDENGAIENYRTSIQLNPDNDNAKKALKKLLP